MLCEAGMSRDAVLKIIPEDARTLSVGLSGGFEKILRGIVCSLWKAGKFYIGDQCHERLTT